MNINEINAAVEDGYLTDDEAFEIVSEMEAHERDGEEFDLSPMFAGVDVVDEFDEDPDGLMYEAELEAENAFERYYERASYENFYREQMEEFGLR